MSGTLATCLYFAIGIIFSVAFCYAIEDEFYGFYILCIFIWPVVLCLLLIVGIISLLALFGKLIGKMISNIIDHFEW